MRSTTTYAQSIGVVMNIPESLLPSTPAPGDWLQKIFGLFDMEDSHCNPIGLEFA
jgi:hypothetical protein